MIKKNKIAGVAMRALSCIMALFIILPLLPVSHAQNAWNMTAFLSAYPDPHFDLNNEPNRVMTIEEFIALMHTYSYYGGGADPVTVVDKNGNAPSSWCAKYVQAEANKKVFDPDRISWNDPVTLAFAAQFMARSKGKYSYDATNIYTFSNTQNLSADDILYLCTAVDYGLIPYKTGMDVSVKIPRRDARKYEIPSTLPSVKPTVAGNANSMREVNAYFIDCYSSSIEKREQLQKLKQKSDHITMVTFFCSYINGTKTERGNSFLGTYLDYSVSRDPQLDAIQFCKETGKLALLGITNASGGDFPSSATNKMLESDANMQIAIKEIMDDVKQYNLDGVNLGIEISDPAYSHMRDKYSEFVSLLSTELHNQKKVLMVSVGAYFTDKQECASIYDYSEIGKAADYVHIILYDDFNDTGYSTRGTHGPISNIVRIGRCIRYASVKMDKSKILLGLGAFAIDFNLTKKTAIDINYADAAELYTKNSATVMYDNTDNAAGAYFEYTDASGDQHRVYFETEQTTKQRANIVKDYNLGGFSVFNLNDNNTPVYRAIDAISSFKPEVTSAIESGLVPINLRSSYDKPILRSEFCSVIVKFIESKSKMSALKFIESKGKKISPYTFYDTRDEDVLIASALGIVGGYGDGLFCPDKTISRQEAAVMLKRLASVFDFNTPNSTPVNFKESATLPTWAKDGVDFISACIDTKNNKRVMGGTGNNMFSPLGTYTREQTFMSIFRLYNAF